VVVAPRRLKARPKTVGFVRQTDESKGLCRRRRVAGAHRHSCSPDLSKYFYIASLTSYSLYLIDRFRREHTQQKSCCILFMLWLRSTTAPSSADVGDRFGRKNVIEEVDLGSSLGVYSHSPRSALADLFWTSILSMIVGW